MKYANFLNVFSIFNLSTNLTFIHVENNMRLKTTPCGTHQVWSRAGMAAECPCAQAAVDRGHRLDRKGRGCHPLVDPFCQPVTKIKYFKFKSKYFLHFVAV